MATQITNYKCPNCTGPLNFVGTSGSLECEYCGGTFSVQEMEALHAEKLDKAEAAFNEAEAQSAKKESESSEDWNEDGMKAYVCPSCGAELICDATTAATSCPYCGNNVVVPGQFSGALKPDYIIPFKLDKKSAEDALKKHYKCKLFLPKVFREQNHIEEIKGVYVPFWLYDGEASGSVEYRATRSHAWTYSNTEVITTEHYRVVREGLIRFEKIPADASTKMPDDHMDSIEPYDYEELKQFSTAYMSGFLADKFDVNAEQNRERVDLRTRNTLLSELRNTVTGYDTCNTVQESVNLNVDKVHYALMPVWMLTTKWKGKNFIFAMNGQTGRFVGDLPVSWKKFWLTFLAIAAFLSALMSIFVFQVV